MSSPSNRPAWPPVAIVVLNWNRREDTLACLASLSRLDYLAYEVIVVDNGSDDDSVAAIRAAYPQITLIERGMAANGLAVLGGRHLV